MRLERISRWFRRPGSEWAAAVFCALVTMALLGIAGWQRSDGARSTLGYAPLLGFGAAAGLFAWWGVGVWRRLWRMGRTPFERAVYDRGVRGWGIALVLCSPALGAIIALALAANDSSAGMWFFVAFAAFIAVPLSFPLALWSGYLWGQMHAGMSGLRDTGRDSLPPAI